MDELGYYQEKHESRLKHEDVRPRKYSVLVGNVGTVLETDSSLDMALTASNYANSIRRYPNQRAEFPVVVFEDGEIKWERHE